MQERLLKKSVLVLELFSETGDRWGNSVSLRSQLILNPADCISTNTQ